MLLLLALVSAGCVGEEDSATPAADADGPPPDDEGGGLTPEDAADAATGDDPAMRDGPAVEVSPFSFEGSTNGAASVCATQGSSTWCQGVLLQQGARGTPVELPGNATGMDLTLAWDATSPATEELNLLVEVETADGWEWFTEGGTSPVTLTLSDLDPVRVNYVGVYTPRHEVGPTSARATSQDAFRIEGTFTVLVEE